MKVLPSRIKDQVKALGLAWSHIDAARGEMVLHDRHGGLFSLYCQVLGCLRVCDILGCSLRLNFFDGDYRTPDCSETGWWTQFFESSLYNQERNTGGKTIELLPTKQSARFAHLGARMQRSLAYKISRRIHVRPEILAEIDRFEAEHFQGIPMIGIHYRGTDKLISEAVRVPYASAIETFSKLDERIGFFVATDEEAFLNAMVNRFGQRVVARDQHRSTDGTPVHHFDPDKDNTGFTRGRDAVIDAQLLSRCRGLIRTPSNLSLASTFLNPTMPTLILNPEPEMPAWFHKGMRKIEEAAITA